MADVEMMPLPEPDFTVWTDDPIRGYSARTLQDYADARVAQATEALRAEVERLNRLFGPTSAEAVEMRHEAVAQKRRAERLAEALREIAEYPELDAEELRRIAHAALHPQEADNG